MTNDERPTGDASPPWCDSPERECEDRLDEATPSRRRFIVTGAAGTALVGLAGCAGLMDDYEEEYEEAQDELAQLEDELQETEAELEETRGELEDAHDELDEVADDHVVVVNTYVADASDVSGEAARFLREGARATTFATGTTVGFAVGIYRANAGDPAEEEVVGEVTVEVGGDVTIDLEYDGATDTWRGTWTTADADPGPYAYEVDVDLEGDARRVGSHEDEFELVEHVGELFDVEFLAFDEEIEVPETTELLIAGEEEWGRGHEDLPYNCRRGVCGRCVARIDGDVHDDVEMTTNEVLPEELMDEGYTLTCTGQPRGDFSIETDVYEEVRDDLE